MKRFLREWRIEILMVLAALAGIFLLVEQISIRSIVWHWLMLLVDAVSHAVSVVAAGLRAILPSTPSDILGWLLIIGVLLVARWRIRWRLLRQPRLSAVQGCPRCGSPLHRIHRRRVDHLINRLVVPVRRYLCSNEGCRWSGLRVEPRKLKRKSAASAQSADATTMERA